SRGEPPCWWAVPGETGPVSTTRPPWSREFARMRAWSPRRPSVRWPLSSPSTTRTRRSLQRTRPNTVWPPMSSPKTCAGPCALQNASTAEWSPSTAVSSRIRRHPSVVSSRAGWVAKVLTRECSSSPKPSTSPWTGSPRTVQERSRIMLIPVAEVTDLAASALRSAGVSENNSEILVRALVEAELRGLPSHGLLRLPRVVERIRNGVADPHSTGAHDWATPAHLIVDGQCGIGQVVATHALDAVSDRARETGLAMATISNSNHIGMLSLYAERIAMAGQVLIGLTTSEALVHPWGGRDAMLGTNPITI